MMICSIDLRNPNERSRRLHTIDEKYYLSAREAYRECCKPDKVPDPVLMSPDISEGTSMNGENLINVEPNPKKARQIIRKYRKNIKK